MHDKPRFVGPADSLQTPRYSGPATFARLPRRDEVGQCDIGILGVPFDSSVSYRPGARFGPAAVRAGSRLLRPYDPELEVEPFGSQQVTDCGDVACNPFNIVEAISQIEDAASATLMSAGRLIAIGGDHTIALPLLRAVNKKFGQPALVHFDAHLDTWNTYFGAPYTHGTPFRRAAEEGLFDPNRSLHVGIRGPLYAASDLIDDSALGFGLIQGTDLDRIGVAGVIDRIRSRTKAGPIYLSVDIDVLDPAHAPGTGTPEAGGLSSRELLALLRGLTGIPIVGADVVEVAPTYDHAELTAIAAAHVIYTIIGVMATASPPEARAAAMHEAKSAVSGSTSGRRR